ncbi:MAG: sigma-70 family RNA polymerase sigma factor, partial [Chloroflexi bacterium CFX6]|nr:sigma-70 family RNA polymerase sigma factor [Chloroflexi bacterium CFX6]
MGCSLIRQHRSGVLVISPPRGVPTLRNTHMPTATSAPTSPPPPPPTEPALGTVRLSPAAFYDAHVTRIYAYFLRRVPDAATAEDLTAVTFERLAAAWPAFVPRGDGDIAVRVWAYRAATNVLRNAWRDGTRRA